jgi:hypothetical protein
VKIKKRKGFGENRIQEMGKRSKSELKTYNDTIRVKALI